MSLGVMHRKAVAALIVGATFVFAVLQVTQALPAQAAAVICSNGVSSSIQANFNGTPIPGGSHIWFSAVLKVQGVPSQGATISFVNQTIQFTANGTTFTVSHPVSMGHMPNAQVTIDPTATQATTTFDTSANWQWNTVTPPGTAGNIFLSGYAFFQVPAQGLPGGIKDVSWSGQFASSAPGVTVNWQWAAAVYTTFSNDNTTLGVKPVDDTHASQYQNSDHAGTPENFKSFVIGGATGGGGSNFTGSLSATASVSPPPCPAPGLNVFVGYADTQHTSPGNLPSPWQGAPNTTFVGDNGPFYDAGAIRLDNTTSGPITVTNVTVTAHGQTFSLWGSFTVPAGGSVILTQTQDHCGPGAASPCSNFDTSETGAPAAPSCTPPPPATPAPTITISLGGGSPATLIVTDSGQVLDTGGINQEGCPSESEFHPWVQV